MVLEIPNILLKTYYTTNTLFISLRIYRYLTAHKWLTENHTELLARVQIGTTLGYGINSQS